jgi:hypothetical protein
MVLGPSPFVMVVSELGTPGDMIYVKAQVAWYECGPYAASSVSSSASRAA